MHEYLTIVETWLRNSDIDSSEAKTAGEVSLESLTSLDADDTSDSGGVSGAAFDDPSTETLRKSTSIEEILKFPLTKSAKGNLPHSIVLLL